MPLSPTSRSPRALLCAAVALLLAGALLPTAATAQTATRPRKAATCGAVFAFAPRSTVGTQVEVVRAQRLSCRGARTIVRRCIAGRLDHRWKATPAASVTWLRHGRRALALRALSGPALPCASTTTGASKVLLGGTAGRPAGRFGPYEEPLIHPDRWPAPYKMTYQWHSPVTTNSASIAIGGVSTARLLAYVRNVSGEARSVWVEWGKTRDLGNSTEKQSPPTAANGGPVSVEVRLPHLKAATRYWWRAAANIDEPSGKVTTHYGTLGSFVTNPYPKIADPARPCSSRPAINESGQLFELTESLAIDCSAAQKFSKGACFPACADFYSGRLTCNRDFPRNLNAGNWSFNLPEIGYPVSVSSLANYWRSNDSNRFLEVPGKNKNSSGGEVGPSPGWHDWDVAQWAYPFTPTSTSAEFWINCTEQWGAVIDGDALAAGQGRDTASSTPPGEPGKLRAVAASDGGIDVSWEAPSAVSPSGIAGYYLALIGWKTNEAKELPPNAITPVTATGLSGHISATNLEVLKKAAPAGYGIYVSVGTISREGSMSKLETVRWLD
jgi:hypothetical protein